MATFLLMRGITKQFPGVFANRDVNLEVRRGEVHGLLGENGAGKTTLVNILYGLLQPDEGSIEIEGSPITIRSPREAMQHGIGMVHQHFMLVPDMTVAENVALGLPSTKPPLSRLGDVADRVRELSGRYGLKVDPEDRIEDLSVGMQQRVEILKLLYRGATLLVLDEPTAVLTPQEWNELSAVLRSLVEEGRSAIFITHKLDELLSVADRCTVLRDGSVVGTVLVSEADKRTLARMMVGREVVLRVVRPVLEAGEPVLEVEDLNLVDARGRLRLANINFAVRQREVLGVAGVDGNGQHELVEVLAGIRRPTSGTIRIRGRPVPHLTPREFADRSGAVIPADRQRMALALDLPLADNLVMREVGREPFTQRGMLRLGAIADHCDRLVVEYDIRTPSIAVRMRQLSGGNQQKTVLARELHRQPKLLIASQPTRGLDVGAMEYVYRRLIEHKTEGGATLLVSTELEEVLSLADRIAVIVDGRFLRILEAGDVDPEVLGLLMAGQEVPV
jgi:general nucleoside transport system ATP-binding protein